MGYETGFSGYHVGYVGLFSGYSLLPNCPRFGSGFLVAQGAQKLNTSALTTLAVK